MNALSRLRLMKKWSVGDYVLSGGELPAMVLIDAVSRFVRMSSDIRHQQRRFLC